ncbi:MAG: pyridoxamine 5'-phosphate oxidase family protein [Pseudomonadota bacterium]
MKPLDDAARTLALELLAQVEELSLATVRPDGYPQATTVNFASDGLTLYVGIGLDSQKAHNIRQEPRVSLTVCPANLPWDRIRALSMGGRADIIADADEMARAASHLMKRFPQLAALQEGTTALPWAGALFIRITPEVISVIDYEQGFGHSALYSLP